MSDCSSLFDSSTSPNPERLKVLVACEFSGTVRDAFLALGHEAVSCDLLPTEAPGPHIQGDVIDVLSDGWDLMVAHPPCTALCVSGNRWYSGTQEREDALEFFRLFLDAPIPRVAVENPVGVVSSRIRPPDQYVQPWWFGHGETKKTGFWLRGLPPLMATKIVEGREGRVWKLPPTKDRWKLRSTTYLGLAMAMAEQWGATR